MHESLMIGIWKLGCTIRSDDNSFGCFGTKNNCFWYSSSHILFIPSTPDDRSQIERLLFNVGVMILVGGNLKNDPPDFRPHIPLVQPSTVPTLTRWIPPPKATQALLVASN